MPGDSVTITAPDVDSKTFMYWTDSAGKILSYNSELTLTIHANTVLNAVYGTETPASQPSAVFLSITRSGGQVMFNVIATVPSGSTITDSNYLFGVAASDDTTYYAAAYVIAGGQTYYSEVETVSDEALANLRAMLFIVSFDANKGSGAMSPQTFVNGISADLTANTFTRDYYTFNGWNTKADGSGKNYEDGATVSLTGNMTLYAQWQVVT